MTVSSVYVCELRGDIMKLSWNTRSQSEILHAIVTQHRINYIVPNTGGLCRLLLSVAMLRQNKPKFGTALKYSSKALHIVHIENHRQHCTFKFFEQPMTTILPSGCSTWVPPSCESATECTQHIDMLSVHALGQRMYTEHIDGLLTLSGSK